VGLALAWSVCAFALNPSLDVSQYAHTAWKIRDGFAKGQIGSIAQTQDGYLWLGTDFGLYRFDGVRAVAWQPPQGQNLSSTYIRCLLVTRDGTLWIGTAGGLDSWKDGRLTNHPQFGEGLSVALFEDREGVVWASQFTSGEGRVCMIRNGDLRCPAEFSQVVLAFHEDRKGDLWASGQEGFWRWKPGPRKFYPFPGQRNGIESIHEDERGAIIVAADFGLRRLRNDKLEPYLASAGEFRPNHLLRDRDGSLWITTMQGLIHVHQERIDRFTGQDGLSGNHAYPIFEDREGTVWVGTTEGLDRFRDFLVPSLSVNQGLQSSTAVLGDRDGSLWISSNEGLNHWDGRTMVGYRTRPTAKPGASPYILELIGSGLPPGGVQSLFQDRKGRLWIALFAGLGYLEQDRFHFVKGSPRGGNFFSVTEDQPGNLWMAHDITGLVRMSPEGEFQTVPLKKGGKKYLISALLADPLKGGLWIGFVDGWLAYFAEGEIRSSYSKADGLGAGRVGPLGLDPDGTLWAATEGGLSRVKNGRIATLTSTNGLPCDAIHWAMRDDDRAFWMDSPCGLVRIAREEIDTWAASVDAGQNPSHAIRITVFDAFDGARSVGRTGGYTSHAVKAPDGRIWYSALEGVRVIDPRHLSFNTLPPPVQVEQLIADRKSYAANASLRLPPLIRDLEIDYTALSLAIPEKVLFRYKLEGRDGDWQDAGTRRQAYYSDLRPRNYRFRVMACNNSGVWNEAGAFLDFSIAPAYYQTTWFRASMIAAFLILLAGLYWLRMRQVAHQFNIRLEERLGERTRIARDLHDTLLQNLAGVSLQLDGISRMAATAPPEKTASTIERVQEQVRSAFQEARNKIWNLRSPVVEGRGLAAALREFVERISPATTARCTLAVSGTARVLPLEIEEELLCIAQEAANNANRHAEAKEIRIALGYTRSSLTLSVIDDGKGFDFDTGYSKTGHWGLKNMQERATQIGGTCDVSAAIGRGTRVDVTVPLSSSLLKRLRAKSAASNSDAPP
jgi:signal transduction histidine kinase/ligand-binding sensor domain-containing protein